jgi:hypothetical protein
MYDTVAQYGQVLGNEVDDWHPPIMVRLWQVLHRFGPGTEPMFVIQTVLYGMGFALLVAALARSGRRISALAAALLAFSPLLVCWQMVVLKDTQMLAALIAASGIVAHYRLAGRAVPVVAASIAGLLIVYATLVRANAVFATAPLAVMLLPRPRRIILRGAIAIAAIALVIGVTPLINHRLLRAEPSGVAKTQPLFDLAAIAVAAPGPPSPFSAAERAVIARRHCVKAFFWDPLGEPTACGPITDRFQDVPERTLYAELLRAIVAHPLAYADHRLRHWNSTERWLVQPNLPEAAPPDEAEANDVGLRTPQSPLMPEWQSVAAVEAGTPLAWPILWTMIALLLVPLGRRRRSEPVGSIGLALVASALTLEASFLVISIASDLRYHLWSMTASALALILLSDDLRMSRTGGRASAAVIALVIAGGFLTRATLPRAPDTYEAMIAAPSG